MNLREVLGINASCENTSEGPDYNDDWTKKKIKASRWMMLDVNQDFRSTRHDDQMQHFMTRGAAIVRVGSNVHVPLDDMTGEPIIAVRKYTNPNAAVCDLAYYNHYGANRCNLAQDGNLGESVYAYTDISTVLSTMDLQHTEERICLRLISG